jgi:hypothetical protein
MPSIHQSRNELMPRAAEVQPTIPSSDEDQRSQHCRVVNDSESDDDNAIANACGAAGMEGSNQ